MNIERVCNMEAIKNFFVKYYLIYSNFIHSLFGNAMGNFVEYLLDIIIVILLIKFIISSTFGNK